MSKLRGLSEAFMGSLRKGDLSPFLTAVKADSTLCLQIREEGINIYYRGGSLIRLASTKPGDYQVKFDSNYFLNSSDKSVLEFLPNKITSRNDSEIWIVALPSLKHGMDLWLGKNPKEEREYQQLVVRENNFGKCGGKTDYLICDIEYAQASDRFDMVAILWPSSSADRKRTDRVRIAFIEMKYADGALSGNSGLRKHLEGMKKFLNTPGKLSCLQSEMINVFNQMHELGLIKIKKKIQAMSDEKPEFILLLANHDPDSRVLSRELKGLADLANLPFDLRFAVSNFMGYGLYRQNIFTLEQFKERFKKQI